MILFQQFNSCTALESSVPGGDNVLVDGFNAAKILRQESSDNFLTLTKNWINFRFKDEETDLRSRVPMIEVNDNNEVIKVRYNNRSIDTINLPSSSEDSPVLFGLSALG